MIDEILKAHREWMRELAKILEAGRYAAHIMKIAVRVQYCSIVAGCTARGVVIKSK